MAFRRAVKLLRSLRRAQTAAWTRPRRGTEAPPYTTKVPMCEFASLGYGIGNRRMNATAARRAMVQGGSSPARRGAV